MRSRVACTCQGETISGVESDKCGRLEILVGVIENFAEGRSCRQRNEA